MKQYINKSALVTEIKTRIETYNKGYANGDDCRADALETFFLHDIDFLEVKEVDDEKKCKEYDMALSIAKAWYKSSDSSAQERNVARMIMGEKVREPIKQKGE